MSTYQSIDDAIYSTPDFQITKKKNSPLLAIIISIIGIAIIVLNYQLNITEQNANLSSGLVFIGGCIAIVGISKLFIGIYGKGGIPVYKPTGAKLIRYKLYYDSSNRDKVLSAVKAGDFEKLATIERSESSALMVIIYRTEDGATLLAQVFQFVPHYHEPMMETTRFGKDEYKFSASLAK